MVGKRFAKNRAERPFFAISAAVPLGRRGAIVRKAMGGQKTAQAKRTYCDEVVKRSKNNRAKAIVIFSGAKTGLFSEEEA